MDISTLSQQMINAVSLGAIYALFSLGYAVVFSILGVLNLAHSAIFMWGAFVGLLALDVMTVPILLSFSIVLFVVGLPTLALEYFAIQRLFGNLPDSIRRGAMLLARLLVLWVAWHFGALIYDIVRGNFGETMDALPPLIALLLAMLSGGVFSVALELVAFRPLRARNAARLAQLISSIGAALVLVNLAQFAYQAIYNRTEAYYPRDIALIPGIPVDTIEFAGLRVTPIRIVILVIALVLMVFLQYMVTRTRAGQQMRAVAYNQRTASLLGIDVSRVYILTFFLAGMFGGASGMLFGVTFSNVTPFIGEAISLVGLTAIVLGGLGSIQGAVLGGFIVAFIQTFSVAFGGSSYRDAILFILLFLVLLVRPQGLLGQPEQNRA